MQKKSLIIILCVLLVVLVGLMATVAVILIGGESSGDDTYQKQIKAGEKYFEDGDYDQAIAAYLAAIDANPEFDEPYYQLAMIYKTLNRMDDMKSILLQGIEAVNSARLIDLYNTYFSDGSNGETGSDENIKDTDTSVSISYDVTQAVANYSYDTYVKRFSYPSHGKDGEVRTVSFSDFNGTLYFFDENNGVSIDTDTDKPKNEVRPNYVVLDNLTQLFHGIAGGVGINIEQLPAMGATAVNKTHDTVLGDCVEFIFNHCKVTISIDKNETFNVNSGNKLISEFGTGATNEEEQDPVYTNEIKVISATTAGGVAEATVNVREGSDTTGEIVFTTKTTGDGMCTLELEAGQYNAEVECDGYIIETFEFEIFTSGVCSVETLTISPELAEGEIRVVLEWTDYPRDLDSYLIDDTSSVRVNYQNRTWYEGGADVAFLDVDDTNGYGPETITVYDTSRNFTYYVHDYTETNEMWVRAGVTVKVYLPGGSVQTFEMASSDSTAHGWCVFSYINGQIITRNQPVMYRGDFAHMS